MTTVYIAQNNTASANLATICAAAGCAPEFVAEIEVAGHLGAALFAVTDDIGACDFLATPAEVLSWRQVRSGVEVSAIKLI